MKHPYSFFLFILFCAPIQAQTVHEYLDNLARENKFSGSVLISRGEEIIFHEAFGLADVNRNLPVTINTKFRIASMTKQFTAMAIMILQERGALNIDQPIGKYLKDYPNGDRIKIKHLLTHMSGLYCFMKDDDPRHASNLFNSFSTKTTYIDEIIEKYSGRRLHFEPGSQFRYCNYGYMLLAKIIEKVSKKRFGDFLQEVIWAPLGMSNTGIDYRGSDCAVGYEKFGVPVEYFDVSCVLGAADMYSTTGDLYKWHIALRRNKNERVLVNPDTLKQIFTPASSAKNGFGWFIYPVTIAGKEHFCVAHQGGSGELDQGSVRGVRSMITRFINDDICVIILSGFGPVNQVQLSKRLAEIIFTPNN